MKINALMIPDPITITEKTTIAEAIERMKVNRIRHLPVVDDRDRLKGFVTLADLKQGLIPYMVGDLTLADLMIRDPIRVSPEDDVETAARLIYEHKIGGMPVVKGSRVVGIITESDMLRAFIDMMGILSSSSRLDVAIEETPEALRQALKVINEKGGDIINVGLRTQQTPARRIYHFRLKSCKTTPIRKALEKAGFDVLESMD